MFFCAQPQPLAFLEEDIREVLKEEIGTDIFIHGQPEQRAYEVHSTSIIRLIIHSL